MASETVLYAPALQVLRIRYLMQDAHCLWQGVRLHEAMAGREVHRFRIRVEAEGKFDVNIARYSADKGYRVSTGTKRPLDRQFKALPGFEVEGLHEELLGSSREHKKE